ncbi:TonB family protein, partial [Arenimonas caeni]
TAAPTGAAPIALVPPPVEQRQYEAWRESVATEACTPGPVSTPAPTYPSAALRHGDAGRVVLGLFVNRCGDVRDAWVAESSGHADIDRAAVRGARKWKTLPPPDGEATAMLRVPITFQFDPGP